MTETPADKLVSSLKEILTADSSKELSKIEPILGMLEHHLDYSRKDFTN